MDVKKIILMVFGLGFAAAVAAHAKTKSDDGIGTIRGRVTDANGAVEFVTVVLNDADGKILGGAVSGKDGVYIIEGVEFRAAALQNMPQEDGQPSAEDGKHGLHLSWSLLGYKDYTANLSEMVERKDGLILVLKDVLLEADSERLQSAVVTGKRPLLEHKFDKIVMNVSELAIAQTGNATDVLRMAPGVTIDKDGNVKLNGRTVAVWIDGRPSQMSGKDLENYLNGSAGNTIEKIEVITSPSAKYDADGSGGIINIKMKKGSLNGLSGSLSVEGGVKFIPFGWDTRFSANLMYKTRKTNTFFSITPSYNSMKQSAGEEKRFGTDYDRFSKSDIGMKANSLYGNLRLGNDWYISDKDVLGVIFNTNIYNSHTSSETGTLREWRDYNSPAPRLWSEIESLTDDRGGSQFYSANLNYTHTFDEAKAQELTANLDYSRSHNNSNDILTNVYKTRPEDADIIADGGVPEDYADNGWNDRARRVLDLYSAKLDYSQIFWKNTGRIEAGAKAAVSVTHNIFNKYDYVPSSGEAAETPKENDDFTYTEQIYAAYVNVAKQFNAKWNAQLGLRGELTVTDGDWKGTSTHRTYFDVFPNVFLNYMPSQKAILSLNYSYRLGRPGYWQLNPFRSYVNATTYTEGNQFLNPDYSHRLSFSGVFWSRFTASLSYSHVKDVSDMQLPVMSQDGVMALKYKNYGRQNGVSLGLSLSEQPIFKWWNITLNTNFMYYGFKAYDKLEEEGIYLTPEQKKKDSFIFYGYAATTFFLPKQWKITIDGWLATPQDVGLFRLNTMGSGNITVQKALLDGKANLALTVTDFTNSLSNTIFITAGDVTTYKLSQRYSGTGLRLSFRWSFGQNTAKQRRNVGVLDEASRLQ